MATPLFVLHNQESRRYKTRRLLEQYSDFEVRKHTGLPWPGARELIEWLEPNLHPVCLRNHTASAETKILTTMGFLRSGTFQWMLGSDSGTSQATCRDSGYARSRYMMVPHSRRSNTPTQEEEEMNNAITYTRSIVERAIGYWKCRFRSMHGSRGELCYTPSKVCKLITVSVVASNYCMDNSIPVLDEDEAFMNQFILPEFQQE